MKILHVAPEPFFRKHFQTVFKDYTSTDSFRKDVDFRADIRKLPLKDAEYGLVFASHVLEHIKEDLIAISEVRRVLRPDGVAIPPVPVNAEQTIELS